MPYPKIYIEDLVPLPRWALVAFAARCARRCFWAYEGAMAEHLERSIAGAEISAEVGKPHPDIEACVEILSAALAKAAETRDFARKESDNFLLWNAIYFILAGDCALAAIRAASAITREDLISQTFLGATIRDDIFEDFDLMKAICLGEKWSDETFVAPKLFSPDAPLERQVMLRIHDLCVDLCKVVVEDRGTLRAIDWRKLEEVIAVALAGLGFEVELTPGMKDGGKDVIARCHLAGKTLTYYIEIKHWASKKVGSGFVSQFVEVNLRDGTDGGLFLSTSGYATSVYSQLNEISKHRIALGNDTKVLSLCQSFVQRREHAIWTPTEVLPKVLFEDTEGVESARVALNKRPAADC
jgi:hypothetical protein